MKTGVRGDLIEVNSRLVEDPNILLEEDPEAEGGKGGGLGPWLSARQ